VDDPESMIRQRRKPGKMSLLNALEDGFGTQQRMEVSVETV
jgi:hypothetical protein